MKKSGNNSLLLVFSYFVSSFIFGRSSYLLPSSRRNTEEHMAVNRLDKNGSHQYQFKINKKKIFATQDTCGICGKPVDFDLRYPHPFSACIDHIIPVAKGGHPSDISNMQLAHWTCNRQKSDKLFAAKNQQVQVISNRDLPQSRDWRNYKSI